MSLRSWDDYYADKAAEAGFGVDDPRPEDVELERAFGRGGAEQIRAMQEWKLRCATEHYFNVPDETRKRWFQCQCGLAWAPHEDVVDHGRHVARNVWALR